MNNEQNELPFDLNEPTTTLEVSTISLPELVEDASKAVNQLMLMGDEESLETVESIFQAISDKENAYLEVFRRLQMEEKMFRLQAENLTQRARVAANQQKRMKAYLAKQVTELNKLPAVDDFHKVSVSESQSVVILDPQKLPAEFVNIKQEIVPDKRKIKAALIAGDESLSEGAYLANSHTIRGLGFTDKQMKSFER